MDRDSHRSFQYHDSTPYPKDSPEKVLDELNSIVARLQHLYDTNQFQNYEFGSDYAFETGIALRDLMGWQKRKLDIPLKTKLHLTTMFSSACFDAVEPSLMVRYGSACLSLWKGHHAKLQLRTLRNVIDWERLIRVVRNAVIVPAIKSMSLGAGGHDSAGNLAFSGVGRLANSVNAKSSSPLGVALSLANLFRNTVELNDSLVPILNQEILTFLGPDGHDPLPYIVLEAFTALIPYNDARAPAVFIPMLFDLWRKVTPYVASLCILPAIAEFAEHITINDIDVALTDTQLNVCYQAVLQSLQIPLISAQKSPNSSSMSQSRVGGMGGGGGGGLGSLGIGGRGITGGGGSGSGASRGGDKLLSQMRSTINAKPFGTHSGAFAKLTVWSITRDDTRSLTLLDSLVNAVLSFCHPSNVGSWTALVFTSLSEVAEAYLHRLNQEEKLGVPEHRRLTAEHSTRLAQILKPPLLMGIHSHAPFIFATALDTLRNICIISPNTVIPTLLGEIYPTLQHGLHEPHRLLTSLASLSRIAVPLTREPKYKLHLTTLLELSLASIDANEPKRCLLALALFQTVSSVTMFEDLSDDTTLSVASRCLPECVHSLEDSSTQPPEIENDAELSLQILRGTSAAYPEILSQFLRRIFELLETTTEHRLGSAASASVLRVLLACSPEIYERLLAIALEEILNPQQLSHDSFAQVCGAFVRANCSASFRPIYDLLTRSVREEILENQAGSGRSIMPRDNALVRYLSILNMSLLAANSESLMEVSADLQDLLILLREKTNVNVVYTVANTLHHAIVGLIGSSVVLPNPLGGYPDAGKINGGSLAEVSVAYQHLKWNVPTEKSRKFATDLFMEHIDLSERTIIASMKNKSRSVAEEDALCSALIFMRTAIGATSLLFGSSEDLDKYRAKILELFTRVYHELGKDDVSVLKEVLFVAKVWLCDFGYERTARLDIHQDTLYQFEKHSFKVNGAHKRGLPRAVIARRAQLYFHQRLALQTQFRDLDEQSRNLIFDVIIDACFSAYPAVRRNAFSALYSPLKIFKNPDLYRDVYSEVLRRIEKLLDEEEYERACGGFTLLKYRSFGVQTIGQYPSLLRNFMRCVTQAAAADHRQLSNLATAAFFMLAPDTFRVGIKTSVPVGKSTITEVHSFFDELTSSSLENLHWRDALFRLTALLAFSECPSYPLKPGALRLFLSGCLDHHPDIRTTSVLGALSIMQKAFRFGFIGYNLDNYSADGEVELPKGVFKSAHPKDLENDWSLFFIQPPLSIAKGHKTQPRPSPKLLKPGIQGWLSTQMSGEAEHPNLWRVPSEPPNGLSELKSEDYKELQTVLSEFNTTKFWTQLLELHKIEPRNEEDRMIRSVAILFRNLVCFSAFGLCGLEDSLETLLNCEVLAQTPENLADKNWHRISSEVFCGLLLSIPVLNEKARTIVGDRILQLTTVVLESLSPENVDYWSSALIYALSNLDSRRAQPLIDLLETSAKPETSSDGGGIKLSLRMEIYTIVTAILQWHRPCLEPVVKQWPRFNHSLQTTRESCGDEIGIAATTMPHIGEKETKILESIFDLDVPKIELSLLHVSLRLLQLIGDDSLLDLLKTKVFPYLLKCSAVRDDPEVVVLVTKVFAELSACTFSPDSMNRITKTVMASTHSAHWHQRMRMLLYIQSFFFNHLLVLSKEQRVSLAMEAINALSDPQAEVRELAADTLSGMVRCCPSDEQGYLIEHLTSKFSSEVGKNTELVKRHAAVLGLGALVGAFPYASPPPPWVPKVLALLAVKSAGDSGIVGKSTKQILGDFKKTRQDTWHMDQKVFSQEELDDLDGVLWKNYFA